MSFRAAVSVSPISVSISDRLVEADHDNHEFVGIVDKSPGSPE